MSTQVNDTKKGKSAAEAAANGAGEIRPVDIRPASLQEFFAKVEELLGENQPQKALEYITRARVESPWARNAAGVCLLRLGNAAGAMEIFRGLSLGSGGFDLRPEAPTIFKTNYAIALLRMENLGGFQRVLEDMHHERHPALERLREAFASWKRNMTFGQKLRWWLGGQPSWPTLPEPLGDLG